MAIRFEEVEAVRARNIDVFANDFVTKISAKTLREIADKLDELNKEKK